MIGSYGGVSIESGPSGAVETYRMISSPKEFNREREQLVVRDRDFQGQHVE